MKLLLTFAVAALTLSLNASAADLTGTIVETMDSGGYTYLLIKTPAGEKKWAAVMKANVKKGREGNRYQRDGHEKLREPDLEAQVRRHCVRPVRRRRGSDRSRDSLPDPHAGAMKGAAPASMPAHGGRAEIKGPIKVAKAAGPDARTVAEIYAEKNGSQGARKSSSAARSSSTTRAFSTATGPTCATAPA